LTPASEALQGRGVGHDAAGIVCKQNKQVVVLGGEVDGLGAPRYRSPVKIENEGAKTLRVGSRRCGLGMAQRHADAGEQFADAEGLFDIVVGNRIQCSNFSVS
jgi:hypothetical protein